LKPHPPHNNSPISQLAVTRNRVAAICFAQKKLRNFGCQFL